MRTLLTGFLILIFLSSLACTSVKVVVDDHSDENMVASSSLPVDVEPPGRLGSLKPCELNRTCRDAFDRPITRAEPLQCLSRSASRQEAKATPQHTDAWCWAASAQMVMEAHRFPVKQCQIVNDSFFANESDSQNGKPCCGDGTNSQFPPVKCWKGGWPHRAFKQNNFNVAYIERALSPSEIAHQLCANGPIVYAIKYEGGGGHTLVVKSMDSLPDVDETGRGENIVLYVHDHSWENDDLPRRPTQIYPISYQEYVQGFWEGTKHGLWFTYVELRRNGRS